MTLDNNSTVTMTGKEYNQIQKDFDKLKENLEDSYATIKVKNNWFNLIKQEHKQLSNELMSKELQLKMLSEKVAELELYKTAYQAKDTNTQPIQEPAEPTPVEEYNLHIDIRI